ncbi:MAG: adenylate/guanylate cyclase domain-containing protein [Elusimicrobiota bacterium]
MPRFSRHMQWALPGAALILTALLQASQTPWTTWAQHRAFDAFEQLRPRPYVDAGVRVIDLDDESLARLGQWPWPRTMIARLEGRLRELGAAATAYDVFFSEPDRTSPARLAASWPDTPELAVLKARLAALPDHDAVLASALRKGRAVLGFVLVSHPNDARPQSKASFAIGGDAPQAFLRRYRGAVMNLPQLESAAVGLGNVGFEPEVDQVIRSAPMIFRHEDALLPSLALEALRVAQKATTIGVKSSGGSGEQAWGQHTGISAVKVGPFVIPTDEAGRMWLYYADRAPGRTIPAWTLFEKNFDRSSVEGAICLVGTSAAGLRDIRATPLNPASPGVEVHANALEQIITQTFLKRPDWALGAEILYLLACGCLLLACLGRAGAIWSGPLAAAAIAGSILFSWHAFTAWRWLLDPILPSLGLFAVYGSWSAVGFVRTERDKRRITDTFGRYLSPKVVETLAKNPGTLELGGQTRDMTIHFCDIRGFTTISEAFDPHGLTEFINKFLTPMTQIILDHDGTIDKYMGDCIMAFWNAPMDVPDHARRACAAALAMHGRLAELNALWQEQAKSAGRRLPLIEIGTGLNTGPCVVGNMGSTLRVDYTVLGDDVNLASRLEGQSKTYGVPIIIGPHTREQAPEFAALELDLIKVKGKTRPVTIFALLGDPAAATDAFRSLTQAHQAVLDCYRTRRWDEAAERIVEARRLGRSWELDKLYDLYDARINAFRRDPPDPAWNGVFTAATK